MNKKFTFLLVALCCFMFTVQAQQTKRVYMIGNSLTDNVNYDGFSNLIQSRGNTFILGSQRIPGSPLSWLWDHITGGFTHEPYGLPQNAFSVYSWDYLSLQPFDRDIEGAGGDKDMIGNFYNLIKSKSPDCKVSIYGHWPRTPNNKSYLDCTKEDYNNVWLSTSGNEARKYYEDLTLAVRAVYPATASNFILAPIGEVMYELNNNAAFLSAMGMTSIWGVYNDGIHLKGAGAYISSCVNYALMYHDDPTGLSVPGAFGAIPAAALPYIHQAVKNVIIAKSLYTGISYFGPAPVLSVKLNASAMELNITKTAILAPFFTPSNAANKSVTWSTSNGAVASVANGVVTANAVGTANITVTTADGGFQSVCAVTVVNVGTAVTELTLNKATTSILVGANETLAATIVPSNATNTSVVWSSSDTKIATVSTSGVVTAVKKGVAVIAASSVNGLFSDTCTVTVKQINNPPVAVMKASPGLSGYAPYKVTFDGRSSTDPDPDDFVLGFDWVVKIKGTSTIIKTEVSNGFDFTFTEPGVYEVTLQAVDNAEQLRSLNTESVTITILEMPAVPAAETAICYEGFDYIKAPITNFNGGRGWSAGWDVQDPVGNDLTGFAVDNTTPLTVENLRQSGNYMKLGHSSEQCGRALDCSSDGAFQDYISPSSGKIGKDGTSLWFSAIVRPQSNNKTCAVSFVDTGIAWYGNQSGKKLEFGCFGGTYWGFAFGHEATQVQHLSTVPIVNDQAVFLVAKVDFGATNTVTLYVNPAPGTAPTGTPVVGSSTMNLEFRTLGTNYTWDQDKMGLDEIRFGTSYADVAPAFVADTENPIAPTNVVASNVLSSSATISWQASTDNTAVVGYEVFAGSTSKGITTTDSKIIFGLSPLTNYNITVKAYDAAGNFSAASIPVSITTGNPDTTPPTNPADLTATSVTATTAILTWTASNDNELIAGYEVYKDGNLIATAPENTFNVTGLQPNTSYDFYVKAKDAAGNLSSGSATNSFTTLTVSVVDGVTARGENLPNEGLSKLTDGYLNSKWLDFSPTSWVKFSYSQAKSWTDYEITSADDSSDRDPKNWTIQGSVDGEAWSVLDIQTNQIWTDRNQTRSFSFSNTTAYNFYKWDITANSGAPLIQASEFKFLSSLTGLSNMNQYVSLYVYPNPAINELNFNFGAEVARTEISIMDLQGRSLLTNSVASCTVHSIDVSKLSNGIYLVKITSDGKLANCKFVKK